MWISVFLFWKNRRQRHVAARVPFLTTAFSVADLLPNTIWGVLLLRDVGEGWKGVPCFLTQPTVLTALCIAVFAIALRATVLVFLFEIGKDVATLHSMGANGRAKSVLLSFKPSFFTRYRRFVQPQMLRKYFFVLAVLLFLAHVATVPLADIPNECSEKTTSR
mgnify:CR=1 FL=1